MVKAVKVKEAKQKSVKATSKETEKKQKSPKVPVDKQRLVKLPDDKQEVIEKFGQKKGDTGSPEVQAALLSHKIDKLTEHLEINKKDNHSRRGLLKVIAKRRRILNYLQRLDEKRYKKLIKEIGLKK